MTGRLRELAAKTFRPAYSGAFADHHLVRCPPLDPVELLTPEWAWGGSEGEGVKVAVVDSGVDAPTLTSAPWTAMSPSPRATTSGSSTTPHPMTMLSATAPPAPGSSAHWRHAASCTA